MNKLRFYHDKGGAAKNVALPEMSILGNTETRRQPFPLHPSYVIAVFAAVLRLALPQPLVAAPDPGTINGSTETFNGNQSAGVTDASPPILTINVNQLNQPIAPASGVTGITLTNNSAGNVTINSGVSGTPVVINATGANTAGISILSVGTPPAPVSDPFLGVPIPNTSAVSGGVVNVTSFSNITTSGDFGYGISAKSSTTGYPSSVITSLNNFSAAGFTFGVDSVNGSSANVGQAVNATLVDTNGNILGAGDKITLNANGSYTFTPGATFAGLALSGTMLVRVADHVSGTSPTNTTGGDSGSLVVKIIKTGSNSFTSSTFGSAFTTYGPSATVFPDLKAYVSSLVSIASAGGAGNSVTVTNNGAIQTSGSGAHGIFATSQGGNGANGSDATILHSSTRGSPGSMGGTVTVTANGSITIGSALNPQNNAIGVLAWSLGGNGGKGGDSGYTRNAKAGGDGGQGGNVNVFGNGTIITFGTQDSGIVAFSQGGNGGGGGAGSTFNSADDGGEGGQGGTVVVSGTWNITTHGDQAHGIWAKGLGGVAGGGGDGGWTGTSSGSGGQGTTGGNVSVFSDGLITTYGVNSYGIYAESVGGFGGNGGNGSSIFFAAGGSGASAGSGGDVSVTTGTDSVITTSGTFGHGIFAQSVGGGGGSGGGAGALVGIGGTGSTGGNGGNVTVSNNGVIIATGPQARGVYAQSIGGGGGDGGNSSGLVAIGGGGSTTSAGGTVKVANTGHIASTSNAVFAQSIGGGGGNGGSSSGWFSFGGTGGSGGDAGTVAVTSHGDLSTSETNASAIFAQSIGGGGGNGGNSVAVGAFGSVAIGGSGAKGGNGKKVTVGINITNGATIDPVTGLITTLGDNSSGIQAQSIGGGGGNGGFAVSAAVGPSGAVSIGIGGTGGNGGSADEVDAYYGGTEIQTSGQNANGIFAQSVGGGGGSGGFSIAASFTAGGPAGAFSMGGSGGAGGDAGVVNVGSASNPLLGQIITTGNHSYGVLAQSIGGGGGNGGFSVAGTITLNNGAALSFGGSGGVAGAGKDVTLNSGSVISTSGTDSHGLFAQSVGGGGGSGGASISGNLTAGVAIGVSFGGSGGGGGSAGNVTLTSSGASITTGADFASGNNGDRSDGILAQSIGGGGGAGGLSVAGGISGAPALNFSMGGAGGTASNAGTVSVTNSSSIFTHGADSHGIFAQSVGGGGGEGGFSVAAAISISPVGPPGAAVSASIGGNGGAGGDAGTVSVNNTGLTISTAGNHSYGILAQSIGGGGGDGGFSFAGGISNGPTVSFSMGGNGATGGNAGAVQVLSTSQILTRGNNCHALFAQSVGGGGGSGGFSVTGNLTTSGALGITLGGTGAGGGNAGNVAVGAIITGTNGVTHLPTFTASPVSGGITTSGNHSYGILAQSIGGSGGDGGFSVAGGITSSANVNFSMGGNGGNGGATGDVVVDSASAIGTTGSNSHGIFAQSLGGGGGSGGFSVTGGISADSAAVGVSIGGNGSAGGDAATVQVISSGTLISTTRDHSDAILAQSVGGGGGDGGFSVAGNISQSAALGFSMGGSGVGGGSASTVEVTSSSSITTQGNDSAGIFAQSLGGGGGSGGFSVAGGISIGSAGVDASIGGKAGGGGNAGAVNIGSTGLLISTSGNRSDGILAQSVGGGGGDGGFSVAGGITKSASVNFSMGGKAGNGGNGSTVTVTSSSRIMTTGSDSHGIFAQSVGGGGGEGGFSVAGGISTGSSSAVTVSVGGGGGGGGSADAVNVTSSGTSISTAGDHSDGILAQSVGGGGGDGGFSVAGGFSKSSSVSVTIGGSGDAGGNAGDVTVTNGSIIMTLGSVSNGILAQSVGGGGGSGGFAVGGSISDDGSGLSFSMGGTGKIGGTAGAVTVANTANIFTGGVAGSGKSSDGILAQSIGGGGGNGGFSGALSGGFGDSKNLAISIGGKAGGGNAANTVTVTSTGNIITTGTGSAGIYAQSVGGGGGEGGFSLAATLSGTAKAVNLSVSIGGKGGTGGAGGVVAVGGTYNSVSQTFTADPITGMIVTSGVNADGILAQSIGGGGGNGGFSAAGTLSTSGTDASNKQLDVSIGGSGGAAGDATTVYVNTGATTIMTQGRGSIGILAQSVGGGGGNGGMSFTGAFEKSAGTNLSVTLGGNGSGGGNGGEVDVTSNNPIFTAGDDAHGVLAQSIGGSGGVGGFSGSIDIGTGGNQDQTTLNLGVAIGGKGAGGGTGGNVTLHSSGGIITMGDESDGIYAQSIGGGGGAGGGSMQGTVSLQSKSPGTIYNISVAVGGGGGSGNTGGAVLVDNNGNISTSGGGSDGILAQSIGGGGGAGGSARTFTLNLPGGGQKDQGGKAIDGAKQNKSLALAIGGNGGAGNNAGTVTVTNVGDVTTLGGDAYGIAAESIGGGGGIGGRGIQGFGVPTPGLDKVGLFKNLQISVGGNGAGSGNGEHVIVTETGNITTSGTGAFGVLAQSIGGGGGIGGASDIGATGKIGIGGAGGAAGNGGLVDVTLNPESTITTFGQGASGILAQSIGGGGGIAGNVGRGLAGYVNIGIGLAFGRSGGGGGDGGVVNVNSAAQIVTHGDGASGIFAQSIGGGGGLVGSLGNDFPILSYLNFAGSVGASGSASKVTVTQTNNIVTFGSASHGIFAQSAGGQGTGGDVAVTLTGSIFATGTDSNGIFAQSTGLGGKGNITVIINSGTTEGGIWSGTSGSNPAGVRIADGKDNTVTNHGTVLSEDGLPGMAILSGSGNETVNNLGQITGSIDLGSGTNTLNNKQSGVFYSGPVVNLGAGNTFNNDGVLAPGGRGVIQTTALTGNFVQTGNASWLVDIGSASLFDTLAVSGSAQLGGGTVVVLNPTHYLPKRGDQAAILTAGGGVTGQYAAIVDNFSPLTILYPALIYTPNSAIVEWEQGIFAHYALTPNQQAAAAALDAVAFNPKAGPLIDFMNSEPLQNLPGDFNYIAPEALTAIFQIGVSTADVQVFNIERHLEDLRNGTSGFSDSGLTLFTPQGSINMHGLPLFASSGSGLDDLRVAGWDGKSAIEDKNAQAYKVDLDKRWGFFITGNGEFTNIHPDFNAFGYDLVTSGVTLGADYRLNDHFAVGMLAGYAHTHADITDGSRITVESAHAGIYGTLYGNGFYANALVGGGYNSYTTHRLALQGVATGTPNGSELDALLGGGYDFRYKGWAFGPIASLRFTRVELNQFNEWGSLAPLHVESQNTISLRSDVGLRLAGECKVGSVIIRPEVRGAWEHESFDTTQSIASRFGSDAGGDFTVTGPPTGRNAELISAGFSIQLTPTVLFYAYYDGLLGRRNDQSHSVSGGFRIDF